MFKKMTSGELSTYQIKQRFAVIKTLVAVAISLAFAVVLMSLKVDNPLECMVIFATGPLTSASKFCGMLNKFIPLLFTGCGVCIMYACGQINLAASSAFYLAGVLCTIVGCLSGIPAGIHFILTALFGAIVGAIVCLIPAVMHVKFKSVMFIAALMLNYVIDYLIKWLMHNTLRDPSAGYEATRKLADSTKLIELFGTKSVKVHFGLIIGLIVIVLAYILIYKTPFGQKLRTVGENREFAKFSGIKVDRIIILTCLIGGAICGLGGAVEVCGIYSRVNWEACPTYGSDGIMIAMIARYNPALVPFAALFLAYVRAGAEMLNMKSNMPIEIVQIIQAIVISFAAAGAFLQTWEHRTIIKNSQALAKKAGE